MKDITSKLIDAGRKIRDMVVVPAVAAAGIAIYSTSNAYGQKKDVNDYLKIIPEGQAFQVPCNKTESCKLKEYMKRDGVVMYRNDQMTTFKEDSGKGWKPAEKNIRNIRAIANLYSQSDSEAESPSEPPSTLAHTPPPYTPSGQPVPHPNTPPQGGVKKNPVGDAKAPAPKPEERPAAPAAPIPSYSGNAPRFVVGKSSEPSGPGNILVNLGYMGQADGKITEFGLGVGYTGGWMRNFFVKGGFMGGSVGKNTLNPVDSSVGGFGYHVRQDIEGFTTFGQFVDIGYTKWGVNFGIGKRFFDSKGKLNTRSSITNPSGTELGSTNTSRDLTQRVEDERLLLGYNSGKVSVNLVAPMHKGKVGVSGFDYGSDHKLQQIKDIAGLELVWKY